MTFDFGPFHNVTDAIIYCRVSSKAQIARGDGLQSQETRCRAYAEFKGYYVRHVFTDDLTGKKAARPGFESLLSFLRSDRKNPHVVLIDDVTRFARNVRVHFDLRDEITEAGGILESPTMEFRDDADSEFNEYIQASASQYQSRKNQEQTVNRMKARCLNGYWVFQPPIGFKYEKIEGHGKLLVRNEPLASIVQEALEGFASGRLETQAEVKRFLENEPEFPKDLPNGQIRNQRVNDILNRVTYAGYLEVPKWGIPIRKAQHQGLISLATHQAINKRLSQGARAPARKDISSDFPLRGFIVCGDCEKPLTANWSRSSTGKKHPYYLCFNKGCDSYRKSIPRDELEASFTKVVRSLTPEPSLLKAASAMFKDAWQQRQTQADAAKAALENKVGELTKQIELLVDRIVTSESATAVGAYEQRIAKLEREKLIVAEKLAAKPGPKRSFDEMFELAFRFLANPWKLWDSNRLEDKRTVLRLAFLTRPAYHRKTGLRTPQLTEPFRFLGGNMEICGMAHPARFERATSAFGGQGK